MGIRDRIRNVFKRNDEIMENNENNEIKEEIEVIINDMDTFALYLKNRERPYILIRDKNFPFMLNNPDLEWIEMNKENFDFYGEFKNFPIMFEKLQKLYDEEELANKKEDDYLLDYLEHSNSGYSKIIDKMEGFEIDKRQYDNLLKDIKNQIKSSIETLYNNHEKNNKNLETTRTYKEIMDNMISFKDFTKIYPYNIYEKIRHAEGSVSHCGYPDYMWQSGAERNVY